MSRRLAGAVVLGAMAIASMAFASDGGKAIEGTPVQRNTAHISSVDSIQGTPIDKNFLIGLIQASTKKGQKNDTGGCGSTAPLVVEGCGQ